MRPDKAERIQFLCPSCGYRGTGFAYVGEQDWDIPELGEYRQQRVDILANCPRCHSTVCVETRKGK